jgi:Aldehyde oxidase and xanthine dehydrogenase, a/b hammerhead domain
VRRAPHHRTAYPPRRGPALLTGRGQYVDVQPAGLLHVAFVRSPYPSARITRIDAQAARAAPGVVDVVTSDDISNRAASRASRCRSPNARPFHRWRAATYRPSAHPSSPCSPLVEPGYSSCHRFCCACFLSPGATLGGASGTPESIFGRARSTKRTSTCFDSGHQDRVVRGSWLFMSTVVARSASPKENPTRSTSAKGKPSGSA